MKALKSRNLQKLNTNTQFLTNPISFSNLPPPSPFKSPNPPLKLHLQTFTSISQQEQSHLMKLPSIFKAARTAGSSDHHYSAAKPWDWTACKHPKTLSFRAQNDAVFKTTVNSIFFDDGATAAVDDSPIFSNSSTTNSTAATESVDGESIETVVRGARSERLFFEPDGTSSIVDKSKAIESEREVGFEESLIVSIESANPYEDFRKSMGEMVESYGVRDWDGLEELLGWYLKANWKNNHRFIIGAFVDLLIDILLDSSSSSTTRSCSNSDSNYYTCTESESESESFSSYSCVSSLRSMDSKGGSSRR